MPRLLSLCLCLCSLTSCTPSGLTPGSPPTDSAATPVTTATPGTPDRSRDPSSIRPPRPFTPLRVHRLIQNGLSLTLLTYDSRQYSLTVLDNEDGPGTGSTSSKAAAAARGGIAAINGGFFTPEGHPLGLVHEAGQKFGGLGSSSLGSAIYLHHPLLGTSRIIRRNSWLQMPELANPESLLQSGPLLIEHGSVVPNLSNQRTRPRSALLWDGQHGWALAHAESTSLATLGRILASQPLPDFDIQEALNLDGGRSSDLWASSSVKGGPISTRHLWNKNVRNYLVLAPNNR